MTDMAHLIHSSSLFISTLPSLFYYYQSEIYYCQCGFVCLYSAWEAHRYSPGSGMVQASQANGKLGSDGRPTPAMLPA